jgi:hypothetical protein
VKEAILLRLREYLDELVRNEGVLRIDYSGEIASSVRTDYLVRMAFRFYRSLYGFQPHSGNAWRQLRCRHCVSPCEAYGISPTPPEICHMGWNTNVEMPCLVCGKRYCFPCPGDENDLLPLCPECVDVIERDLGLWTGVTGQSAGGGGSSDCSFESRYRPWQ